MARKIELDISGGFYVDDSKPIANNDYLNCYVRIPQTISAVSTASIVGAPGIRPFLNLGKAPNRGGVELKQIPYFVNGDALFRINANGTFDELGIITGSGGVSMCANGTQIVVVVPGGASFVYDTVALTFHEITNQPGFLGPFDSCVYKDTFIVFVNSEIFQISAPNDAMTFNALDFGSSEADPDNQVGAIVNQNQLFILGRKTTQRQQNRGGIDFPFFAIQGAVTDIGLAGKFLITDVENTFAWVGSGRNEAISIYRFIGGNVPQKISTHAIDEDISQYSDSELENSSFAFNYGQDGHFFAVFTFPRSTFIYDLTSSDITGRAVWHRRESVNSNGAWRVQSIVGALSSILVGDRNNDSIGILDPAFFREYTIDFQKLFRIGPFSQGNERTNLAAIEVSMETGVGNIDKPDPQLFFSKSDDGVNFGQTRPRAIGEIGQRKTRLRWRRLGSFATIRGVEFSTIDPIKFQVNRIIATLDP